MSTAPEFVWLRQVGYTGSLADMRVAYYNDLIAGRAAPFADNAPPLAVGEAIPDIEQWTLNSSAAIQPASGTVSLSFFIAKKTETINTLTVSTGSVAAAATPTLCRMGIYNVDSSDNCTDLAGSTANDTTLFAATQTQYSKALSAPWNKVAGRRYAFAEITVSATTMPLFVGAAPVSNNLVQQFAFQVPRRYARILAQADLPASILVGSQIQASYRIGVTLS
ncbi:MAG TPA: hypothetical protein VLG09_01555 [Candidatus Saccharimonadales bacterium]|nr:hypothetical protein [Candidatus Saccharimonadales bacterium]